MAAADPPYQRIASEIRAMIVSGELAPGDRVLSTQQITERWGVAKATAGKVIDVLRREGLVETRPRVGTIVAQAATGDDRTARTRASRTARTGSGSAQRLDADRIVAGASAIADEHGLSGLSMRDVASRLDVPTMSLYRHIRDKERLLELMADAAFGEIDYPPEPPVAWRPHLALSARLHWEVYRRHPWLPALVSLTHPTLLPHLARYGEWCMQAIRKLGLGAEDSARIHLMFANYVRGTATNLELHSEMRQRTGLSGGQWLRAQSAAPGPWANLEEYPAASNAVKADPGFDIDLDEVFEFGLQRLLDGVAVVVGRRSG